MAIYEHEIARNSHAIRQVLAQAVGELANYTVSFVYNGRHVGSGTLVIVKDSFGILTAEHVDCKFLEYCNVEAYRNRAYMDLLEDTTSVANAKMEDYDAIYLTGGHRAIFDFSESPDLAKLVAEFYEADKFVSAVCH